MNLDDFKLVTAFASYISKPEITAAGPTFLVKGSINVLIDYAQRVRSRNGYTLFGAAAGIGSGIKGSYEWLTSTGIQIPLRMHDGILEFFAYGTWMTLRSGFAASTMAFAKIWDNVEKIGVLLGVIGDTNTYKWSGGITRAWKSTSTTVTKQGVLTADTGIAFIAGTPGLVAPTITDISNNFLNAGFAIGDTLYVTGSAANSRNFTIAAVTANKITLIMTDVLVSEVATPAITLHNGSPTWATSRFLTKGSAIAVGTVTISIANPAVITVNNTLALNDTVQFQTTGALPTGLTAGTDYYVVNPSSTSFSVAATPSGSPIVTSGSQSGVQSATKTDRYIVYNGVAYQYTGGETTDTLTGLVGFPTVNLGDIIFQQMTVLPNPSSIPANFKQDLIGVQLNQLILASSQSQDVYISSTSDYTNFTLTSPRLPGDPAHVTMDAPCTCIVPINNPAQTTSSIMFGGGDNEYFQLSYQLSQDNANEIVRMIKLTTAISSGLIAPGAIAPVKQATVYISREPAMDYLSNVERQDVNDVPISDPIKDDFDAYDFTNAHTVYYKRQIISALPNEGVVLIYDLMRKLWQPPQTLPISRLAIIDDQLYGHSAVLPETYKLFVGTNDNGNPIEQKARFAYNNGGRRDRLKNMSEYWSDGYITGNGELDMTLNLGFNGINGTKTMSILGSDTSVVIPGSGSTLGDEPLGSTPIGGATLGAIPGLAGTSATMLRFWQADTMSLADYTEYFIEYSMTTLDGQFAVVAHGSDQWDADTAPISHKK